ncbi:MAG: branched-chain amino acid ABC transporter permease, partial [Caldimonas sp.]
MAVARQAVQARSPLTARVVIWGLFTLVMLVAPLVFTSNLDRSILSQIGIAIVACLSYNILLG